MIVRARESPAQACLDQTCIEESLALLPIFLASCKTLIILPGATFPSRLWCKPRCASKLPVFCTEQSH